MRIQRRNAINGPFRVSFGDFQSFDNEVMKSLFLHNDTTSIQGEQKGEKKKKGEPYLPPCTCLTVPSWTHTLLHSARHFPSPPGSQFEIHNNHVKNLPIKLPISINHGRPIPPPSIVQRCTIPHTLTACDTFSRKIFSQREKREEEKDRRGNEQSSGDDDDDEEKRREAEEGG